MRLRHRPRGYRELRSNIRKLLNRKIAEQNRQCAICEVAFTNYGDIVRNHIDPRGMGGSRSIVSEHRFGVLAGPGYARYRDMTTVTDQRRRTRMEASASPGAR